MITAGDDYNFFISRFLHQPVFLVNPARPASFQFMLQWLGLANAFKRIISSGVYKLDYFVFYSDIVFCPVLVLGKGGRSK
jgi:hypothetical protein